MPAPALVPSSAPRLALTPVMSASSMASTGAARRSDLADVLAVANASAAALVRAYGYFDLPQAAHLELDAPRVEALVSVCGAQLRQRALDTPLIFSSLALDLSPQGCASLLRTYLGLPSGLDAFRAGAGAATPATIHPKLPSSDQLVPPAFAQEVAFANPNDLAALIKWALSRIGKVIAVPAPAADPGLGVSEPQTLYVQQRGFLSLDIYAQWRAAERRAGFPENAFSLFVAQLPPPERKLLLTVFSLLSSTVSYSLKNGMTPSRTGRTFGPLLFGLPEDETFGKTYAAYVRVSNAAEHLLLAYIRQMGATTTLPVRLAEHVADYVPSMSEASSLDTIKAHIKQAPLTIVQSNVRLYSPDLVTTACLADVKHCPEWDACLSDSDAFGRRPQLSDRSRKLLKYTGGVQGVPAKASPTQDHQTGGVHPASSLAEVEWGNFASLGFEDTDATKLRFDLTESQRSARRTRPKTMIWSDFAQAGFGGVEEEDSLDTILAFDAQLKSDLEERPDEREALMHRLKEIAARLPAFNYPTEPIVIASPSRPGQVHPQFDPMFAEVWADYLIGSGWSNRDELSHRPANFVVLQYKSVKTRSSGAVGGGKDEEDTDPRTEGAWFVLEENVPPGYRAELDTCDRKREKSRPMLRKFSLFKRGTKKGNKPVDPDDVFQPGSGGGTKILKLSDEPQSSKVVEPGLRVSGSSVSPLPSPRNTASSLSQHTVLSDTTNRDFDPPSSGKTARLTAGGTKLISAIKSRSANGKNKHLRPLTPGSTVSTEHVPHSPHSPVGSLGKGKVRHELAGVVSGMASVANRRKARPAEASAPIDFDIVSVADVDPQTGRPVAREERWGDVQIRHDQRSSESSALNGLATPKATRPSLVVEPPRNAGKPRSSPVPMPSDAFPSPNSSPPVVSGPPRYLSSGATSPSGNHAVGRARLAELRGASPSLPSPRTPSPEEDGGRTPTMSPVPLAEEHPLPSLPSHAGAGSKLLPPDHPLNLRSALRKTPSPTPGSPEEARSTTPTDGRLRTTSTHEDPFDKSRGAGRVARLAGQFGAVSPHPSPNAQPANAQPVLRKPAPSDPAMRPESFGSDAYVPTSSPDVGKNARLYAWEKEDAQQRDQEVDDPDRAEASAFIGDFMQRNGSSTTLGTQSEAEAAVEAPVRPTPLPLGSGLGLSGLTRNSNLTVPPSPSASSVSSSSLSLVRPNSFEAPHQWRFTTDLPPDEQEQLMEEDIDSPVFRERYQPGQPLHSLVEADEESLRSSITSASLSVRGMARV